jgi:class 3 adenylate cyclase
MNNKAAFVPDIRFATSHDVTVAFQVVGDGDVDLISALGSVTHLEVNWEEPSFARFLKRLSSFSRLLLFDKRGVGLSDRISGAATLEDRMDDLRAVMDAVGSERAVVLGASEGGPMGALFAATFPQRTQALILYGSNLRGGWHEDDPIKRKRWPTKEDYDRADAEGNVYLRSHWGEPLVADTLAPSMSGDQLFANWCARLLMMGSSPASLIALSKMNKEIDIRHVLPTIRVPTLVLHRRDDTAVPVANSRYLAEHIPGARYVELEGRDHLPFIGDADAVLDEIEEFTTGLRRGPDPDRVLTTVLFTDIVSSTARGAELGDRTWRDVLESYLMTTRQLLARWRGREVKTTGDGCLATFDGPGRAVRCACAVRDGARAAGLEIRAGVHTGEVEMLGNDVSGIAVNLCSRIQALASPGEVLASGTVKDLVAGSGIRFDSRGSHRLRGVPGEWALYAAQP